MRSEKLYIVVNRHLKNLRRKHEGCIKNIEYKLNENKIRQYILSKKLWLNMNDTEIKDGLNKLFDNILPNRMPQNIEGLFYADLSSLELSLNNNNNDCWDKINIWLLMKTYGFELIIAVISITILLISWRKFNFIQCHINRFISYVYLR